MVGIMGRESSELKRIELNLKEKIDLNNILITASLAYLFAVLFAVLRREVEPYFGTILVLTAIMVIWALLDWRKSMMREYNKLFRISRKKKHKT
jgi:inner membrane protein involved in colicin E2 resistance